MGNLFAYSCRDDDAAANAAVARRATIAGDRPHTTDPAKFAGGGAVGSAVSARMNDPRPVSPPPLPDTPPVHWRVAVERPHYVLVDNEYDPDSHAIIVR